MELVARNPEFDAVMFAAQAQAVGAILECNRRNWNIPQKIAIAGFDDNDIANQITPRLMTVRIPRYEIGQAAAEVVFQRLVGHTIKPRHRDLGFEIVTRETT